MRTERIKGVLGKPRHVPSFTFYQKFDRENNSSVLSTQIKNGTYLNVIISKRKRLRNLSRSLNRTFDGKKHLTPSNIGTQFDRKIVVSEADVCDMVGTDGEKYVVLMGADYSIVLEMKNEEEIGDSYGNTCRCKRI